MPALEGKIALVTASSRGIGRAIAERLAHDGANVAVNYHIDQAAADDAVQTIRDAGRDAVAIQADLGSLPDIAALYDTTTDRFGSLDIVVNNHASITFSEIAALSEADYDRVFAVTAKGTFFSLQHAAQHISDGGRIINISAGGTVSPNPQGGAYHGAKAAVEQFTTTLSRELGARAITVNAVLPGATQTDGLIIPQSMIDQLIAQTPLGRLGQPKDIAAIVAFLASPDADWITGQLIRAGGGLM